MKQFAKIIVFFVLFIGLIVLVANFKSIRPLFSRAAGTSPIDDTPVNKKVFLLIFNPILESQNNVKLTEFEHWNDPDMLTSQVQTHLQNASHGYVTYTIQERQEVDSYYKKQSGYTFTDDSFLACINQTGPCNGELISYAQLFADYGVCNKNVDEVWIWGGPWFGYYEYNPVSVCGKTTFVMGFNYERGIGEAIHDFGHRMEYVGMLRVGRGNWSQNELNEWNKFSLINGHCGNIHYPPGTIVPTEEYMYDKSSQVTSDCDGYNSFPVGPFITQTMTCAAWGCTQEGFVSWWLSHIPHSIGTSLSLDQQMLYNNWWKYYAFFDETAIALPTSTPSISPTPTPVPQFSNLTSSLVPKNASFGFAYAGPTSQGFIVDMSITPDMSSGTYLTFALGPGNPVIETNPEKWDHYTCGRNFWWTIKTSYGYKSPIQAATVVCSQVSPTPTFTPAAQQFSNLTSKLVPGNAQFGFTYTGPTNSTFTIDMSITPDMSSGTYLTFGQGAAPLVTVTNPEKWDHYTCGRNFWWTVKTSSGFKSQIQSAIVECSTPTPTPTNTPTPTFTPAPTPTPIACKSADINKNGDVDAQDLSLLLTDIFASVPTNSRSDINNDGIVDITDYSLLVSQFLIHTGPCQ